MLFPVLAEELNCIFIKLALTSPTSGGRSVGIFRLLTKTMEFVCLFIVTSQVGGSIVAAHNIGHLGLQISTSIQFYVYEHTQDLV
jgi:hypothetical protein